MSLADCIRGVHHVAIISSNYEVSKDFYTRILGCDIIEETYRAERDSWKLDLQVPNSSTQIELFSFPTPPKRTSRPEACGLRHLAFAVNNIDTAVKKLEEHGIAVEEIRVDPITNQRFTFFADPDDLPLELYEQV
ncbi:glyoxalase/bleomycin resistance protein/dioxygenase [Basidiobolus meristosporus CBS 931.73]|uniref:Glyoxalase/bleomycin resistance protein/dioxygenase n=1 Tax=Basidiobolus meristosporus CBS 931.73 TaxID=1314790 RepID=A0A1Y1XUP7_9FUNG|nr:glyoxalase/bleomycin resistance protein/dioxygenase [Basidiobolus meristosporus CBS 931.73]|eukprot:ORX89443.1 glyoxalase/bleomycin resistance protein/dioxygenase [Basidiobolus meristosporus CBS 931.73]